jgi:alpha-galactosidase
VDRNLITGQIVPDSVKFPTGMTALAEYVHSKGLLFGLYSDAGTKTCQGRPGSYGYEDIDAQTYAQWK